MLLLPHVIRLESIMLKSFATILFQNSFIALLLFPLLAIVLKKCFKTVEKRFTIHMDTKNGENINDGCIETV